MSSNEFESIFNNAAGIILARLKNETGTVAVLDDLKAKVARANNFDPVTNRTLIIEPALLSQRLRVPRRTVELVADELRRLNLVHLWVRAICPIADEDDDNVIVETNDRREFREAIQQSCSHCGQIHSELGWAQIETFQALHLGDAPDKFSLRRLLAPVPRVLRQVNSSPDNAQRKEQRTFFQRATDFFASWARMPASSPVANAIDAELLFNQPNSLVPSKEQIALRLVKFILLWGLVTAGAFILCRAYADLLTTVVVTSILIVAGVCAIAISLKMIYSVSILQTSLLSSGYLLASGLFASSWDFEVRWGEDVPFLVQLSGGRIDPTLTICATVVFTVTTVGVVGSQFVQGWYANR